MPSQDIGRAGPSKGCIVRKALSRGKSSIRLRGHCNDARWGAQEDVAGNPNLGERGCMRLAASALLLRLPQAVSILC